jgi:hypothetical protein
MNPRGSSTIWRLVRVGVANPMTAPFTFWGGVNERAMDPGRVAGYASKQAGVRRAVARETSIMG